MHFTVRGSRESVLSLAAVPAVPNRHGAFLINVKLLQTTATSYPLVNI